MYHQAFSICQKTQLFYEIEHLAREILIKMMDLQ